MQQDTDTMIERAMLAFGKAAIVVDQAKVKDVLRSLLETATAAASAQAHQQRVEETRDDTEACCRYFGELGITKAEAEKHFGRVMTVEEQAEMIKGAFGRRAEARALELGQARQGGKVLPWMTTKV